MIHKVIKTVVCSYPAIIKGLHIKYHEIVGTKESAKMEISSNKKVVVELNWDLTP